MGKKLALFRMEADAEEIAVGDATVTFLKEVLTEDETQQVTEKAKELLEIFYDAVTRWAENKTK
ncbi:MAG TPA: hypothetical protein VEA37_13445 [Flavobacterium sp.]|nr:hypothetical protein [Flavobacterium sp.]